MYISTARDINYLLQMEVTFIGVRGGLAGFILFILHTFPVTDLCCSSAVLQKHWARFLQNMDAFGDLATGVHLSFVIWFPHKSTYT